MRTKNRIQHKVIYFTQWTRKAYAVFASLHKVVNILRLSVEMCISSFSKNKTILAVQGFHNASATTVLTDDQEASNDNLLLIQLLDYVLTIVFSNKNKETSHIIPITNFPKSIFYPV